MVANTAVVVVNATTLVVPSAVVVAVVSVIATVVLIGETNKHTNNVCGIKTLQWY